MHQLKIEIKGKEYTLTGGTFYEMLEQVKALPGQRWDSLRKIWILPDTLEETRAALENLDILGSEDEVLAAEILEIQKFQSLLEERHEEVQLLYSNLVSQRDKYSYTSKSSRKMAVAIDAACLHHALASAKKPCEELIEVEVRGLKRACEIMGWL